MAELNKEIIIKLTIDDKEFITILNLVSSKIDNLNSKFDGFASKSKTVGGGTIEAASGTKAMDNALSELGSTLLDSGKFLNSFKDGTTAIWEHLSGLIYSFAGAKKEAGDLGTTIGKTLVSSLAGPGGLSLAISGVSLLLELLPSLFNKSTKEIKGQAEEVENLANKYDNLTQAQLDRKVAEVDLELAKLTKEFQEKYGLKSEFLKALPLGIGNLFKSFGELTEEEQRKYTGLVTEKAALDEVNSKLGYTKSLNNEINLLIKKRSEIKASSPDDPALKYYDEWIKKDKELLKKSNKNIDTSSSKKNDTPQELEDDRINNAISLFQNLTTLNELQKTNNYENIKQTEELIAKELKHYLSIENKIKLLQLKNKVEDEKSKDYSYSSAADYEANPYLFQDQGKIDFKWGDPVQYNKISKTKEDDLKDWYDSENQKINAYDNYIDIKKDLDEEYNRRSKELDKENLLSKINTASQIINALANAYNQLYGAIEKNVNDELDIWEGNEKRKLDIERKSALSHARTSKQKEKINEEYDKKEQVLQDEKKKKAHEALATAFEFQKAFNYAQAVSNTALAATNALTAAPPPWNFALMASVIAAGMAQVAVITMQKMPGYAKGGAVIGENGPEIIAPFQDYASGQSKLITMTMMTLRDEIKMGNGKWKMENGYSTNLDLVTAISKLNKRLDEGINSRAYLDDRQAKKIFSRGSALNRKSKI